MAAVVCAAAHCEHGGDGDDSGDDDDVVPGLDAGYPSNVLWLKLLSHFPHSPAQAPGFLRLDTAPDEKLRSVHT